MRLHPQPQREAAIGRRKHLEGGFRYFRPYSVAGKDRQIDVRLTSINRCDTPMGSNRSPQESKSLPRSMQFSPANEVNE